MKPLTLSLVAILALEGAAWAQESPAQTHLLPSPPGWHLPAPQVQLEMDPELVPVGKGAVFVPAMTSPSDEPPYVVLAGGNEKARTPTGRKTILPPGRYTVLVGSGVEQQMLPHEVEVFEGHTVLIDPDWGGLVVRVVDERGVQFRSTYEVFALPSGEDYGLGLGADETRGETLRTWLLPPGRYMIVKSGETPRARTDFLTLRLLPGEVLPFTLVQSQEDGRFFGGGVVDRGEGKTEIENWRLGLVVGGDLLWDYNHQVLGRDTGGSITLNGFLDWSMRYLSPSHLVYARLQVDEGQNAQPHQDLKKTVDEANLDAIYTYRLLSWLGPYVRFGLRTNLFPGYKLFANGNQHVVVLDASQEVKEDKQVDKLRLAGSFDPLELKQGAGASFDLSPALILDLHLRLGFGAREYFVQSLLKERDVDNDPVSECQDAGTECFQQVPGSQLLGLEATLIASARLTRWLMIDTELDGLVPFVSSESGDHAKDPVISWKNTVSLRLVSFASLAYVIRMDYNHQLTEKLQTEHRVLLRFTFDIL